MAKLHGQVITSYLPTLVEGAGILEVTETYAPATGSGYINKTLVRSSDTAAMRKYMVAEMAYQLAESDRYEALQIEARAKHDTPHWKSLTKGLARWMGQSRCGSLRARTTARCSGGGQYCETTKPR